MKYYKAFKRDMTCRDFQYKEGGVYEIQEAPILCERGFHFMKALVLTLEYYPVSNDITENLYAEVEPLGEIVWEEPTKHKGCTNKLKIVRVIPDDEVKGMLVDARFNSGEGNSGHRNSGDWNSGNRNSGYGNSGNRNSGDRNSGNWNQCHHETGAFNTEQSDTIRVFNKPCLKQDFENAYKPRFLYFEVDKSIGYKESFKKSWENADHQDRIKIKDLPNFDPDVFYELSGIRLSD